MSLHVFFLTLAGRGWWRGWAGGGIVMATIDAKFKSSELGGCWRRKRIVDWMDGVGY